MLFLLPERLQPKRLVLCCVLFAWGVTVVGGQRRGVLTRAKEEPGGGGLGVINYGEDSSPNLSASAPRLVVTELGKSVRKVNSFRG